jgi:hypothetical protein
MATGVVVQFEGRLMRIQAAKAADHSRVVAAGQRDAIDRAAAAPDARHLVESAMDRTAVFVDAGYLFAEGSRLLAGEKLARGDLHLDPEALFTLLGALVQELTGIPLLRVYWYDGASAGPTPQQLALAHRASVKLRLGFLNEHGQQKGVDSLILSDLINLARNRAMADALLLTGDEDLRVGVQQAQELGIRVHLIGIAPARDNQSVALMAEADSVRELTLGDVGSFLTRVVGAGGAPGTAAVSPTAALLEGVATRLVSELDARERESILQASTPGAVPTEIDRRLLLAATKALGAQLDAAQKRALRAAFVEACRTLGIGSASRRD